jgi:hypothetical protein
MSSTCAHTSCVAVIDNTAPGDGVAALADHAAAVASTGEPFAIAGRRRSAPRCGAPVSLAGGGVVWISAHCTQHHVRAALRRAGLATTSGEGAVHVFGAEALCEHGGDPAIVVDAALKRAHEVGASLVVADDVLALCMLVRSPRAAVLIVRRIAGTAAHHSVVHAPRAAAATAGDATPLDARLRPARGPAHSHTPAAPPAVSVWMRLVGGCDVAVHGATEAGVAGCAAWAPISLLRYAAGLATRVVTVQPLASGYSREVRGRFITAQRPSYALSHALPGRGVGMWQPHPRAPAVATAVGAGDADHGSGWVASPPPVSRLFGIGHAGGAGGGSVVAAAPWAVGTHAAGGAGSGLVRLVGEASLVVAR